MEITQSQTTAHFIQCQQFLSTQALLTLQLFTLVGNVTSLLFRINHMESITCRRSTVQSQNQYRFGRTGLLDALVTFIKHGFHLTITSTSQDYIAHFQRTVCHQHSSHITASLIQRRFNDRTGCLAVGISLQIQHFSFQQYFFQQIVYTCTFLCRNILRLILTTPLFHQEVHGSQFFLNLIRIGVRLIHLINSKYDRHTGSHSMINRLFGLRHHIIIGSYNNNSNIRHFRTTGTHGGKCLVTRSIQECNMTSVFQFHIVSTDMLGDTTCLTGNYICFTNIVQ